jgi:multiple sugar transport system ATP-binding protein
MDEPLSNLDAKLRVQMRAEIAKLHERLGATIIYVTHDQTEAMTLGTRIVVMKDGVIQQCDTPSNLYNAPDNLFVAGFIGSPQMNFIDANVVETNGGVKLMIADKAVEIPDEKAKALKDNGYVGKTVVMGIRPENIYFSNSDTNKKLSTSFNATVGVSELLGSEVLLYFDFAGTSVTAKISQSDKIGIGDNIEFAFDINKIHLFDKETEQAIVH